MRFLDYVPTAHELDAKACHIVDGTLLPCCSWKAHPELYSGKHKTTGMNVQVACTITGCLAWISDPISGSRHDNHCLGESGVLLSFDPRNWLGDKGYVGNNMITPFKKPEGGELLNWQKEFNKQVNKIRYVIEQVIANFKTWRGVHSRGSELVYRVSKGDVADRLCLQDGVRRARSDRLRGRAGEEIPGVFQCLCGGVGQVR